MKTAVAGDPVVALVEKLDLSKIKRKLMMSAPDGKGWTQDQADEAEVWYRRFLTIIAKYPEHVHVPNGPIDSFWHQHILDTHAYATDCQRVFGRFMHHNPYYGIDGGAELYSRERAFEEMNALYQTEFGERCTEMVHFKRGIDPSCSDEGGCDTSVTCNGQ